MGYKQKMRLSELKFKQLALKQDLARVKKSRMETKNFTARIQIKSDANVITGYASTFGNIDEHGDIVVKGAFLDSIPMINREGIPLLDSHTYSASAVIGKVIHAVEDNYGLKITAKLSNTPNAQEIKQKIKEGHITKMSIGFDTVKERFGRDSATGKQARFLESVRLLEVSIVALPANSQARILSLN